MNDVKEMHERNDESEISVRPSFSVRDESELQFLKQSSGMVSHLMLTSAMLLLLKLP